MAVLSNYIIDKLLDKVYRNTNFTSPTTLYVALHTAEPLPDGSGAEVSTSGTAYVRQAVTFAAVASHQSKNSGAITWPTATASWGSIPWMAVWDASSAGNLISYAQLPVTVTVSSGQTMPTFAINSITASFV